jgi:hypothetical protein
MEAVNLVLIRILKDDPQAIGTVTLGTNDLLIPVVMGDRHVLHGCCHQSPSVQRVVKAQGL